nr:TPA_asm: m29 uORF RNA *1 [Murid betaherpesvirus 1]DBA07755.1 TPA_asm: m29 uORF RNA *1 [Murid betaherpesvirus 1]
MCRCPSLDRRSTRPRSETI